MPRPAPPLRRIGAGRSRGLSRRLPAAARTTALWPDSASSASLRRKSPPSWSRRYPSSLATEPPPGAPLRCQLSLPVPPLAPSPAPPSSACRSLDFVIGRASCWVEFWTAATAACDRFLEVYHMETTTIPVSHAPSWLRSYLEWVGSLLRRGGWGDYEAKEVVEVLGALLVFATRNLGFF